MTRATTKSYSPNASRRNPRPVGPCNSRSSPVLAPLCATVGDMRARGWDACDVILVSGDACVDHPSFGPALVARFLESLGCRVGILAQPDYRTPDSFLALGKPRLFWGITAGNVDSQLARLTIMRKQRHDDPYTPGGRAGARPPNASIVYASLARHAHSAVPVVLGGIEASLRRFAYYDYWTDKVRRSILLDAKADLLVYGMAEKALAELYTMLKSASDPGQSVRAAGIRGVAEVRATLDGLVDPVLLPSFEEVAGSDHKGKLAFAEMTRLIHAHHLTSNTATLVQPHADRFVVVHPPAAPLTAAEIDSLYGLPFTRRPHPMYGKLRIPAFDMIRHSITAHRGCYASCAFCAITAHQGRTIQSRTPGGVLAEIGELAKDPAFSGTITDIGGPTANMYGTGCSVHRTGSCRRNCLYPDICPNLDSDPLRHGALLAAARRQPGVRHVFVGSGLRVDLALAGGDPSYLRQIAAHHVSGRLKTAPEHCVPAVLQHMRKPELRSYSRFLDAFRAASSQAGKNQEVVEYYMSGHPGCTLADMVELACRLHRARLTPEQVQDFYPAPMTLAAAMFHTGQDPLTGQPVYVAKTDREKTLQRALLLHAHPAFHRKAREALREAGRPDLIGTGPNCLVPPGPTDRRPGK